MALSVFSTVCMVLEGLVKAAQSVRQMEHGPVIVSIAVVREPDVEMI